MSWRFFRFRLRVGLYLQRSVKLIETVNWTAKVAFYITSLKIIDVWVFKIDLDLKCYRNCGKKVD